MSMTDELSNHARGNSPGVYLGMDATGDAPWLQLFNPEQSPHLAIAGQTGSGKSFFIGSIYAQLTNNYSPDQVQLWIGDPKGTDFAAFVDAPHTMKYISSEEATKGSSATEKWLGALADLQAEGGRRQKLFREMSDLIGVSVIKHADYELQRIERNLDTDEFPPMPLLVIGMDECHEVLRSNVGIPGMSMEEATALHEEAARLVAWVVQKTRSYGFVMILATQYPNADSFGGTEIRSQCNRLALKLNRDGAQMMGVPAAADFCKRGQGLGILVDDNGDQTFLRGFDPRN